VRDQKFNGSTGPLQFNSDGDRLGSYDVVNFGPSQSFQKIGLWDAAMGLDMVTPMFSDGSYSPGAAVPPRDIYHISDSTITGTTVLSSLSVILAFGADILLWVNRLHKVIKTSSVTFCHLIVLGCLMGLLYPSILGSGNEKAVCIPLID
jgi:hypothetical protein